MNIIIEGPDSTGKSTLANMIAQHVFLPIQPSEGPPQSQEEIVARAEWYLTLDNKIFDRHPCVSEPIYGQFRDPRTHMPPELLDRFYQTRPLFIYCHGKAPGEHQLKDYDTPEHLDLVSKHEDTIHNAYIEWAYSFVHMNRWYSLKDPRVDTIRQIIINSCQELVQ